ncbi:MAG: hypothetical protein PHD95_03985, partial [Candidatus ainarchaeum sp.]|nr:hypothetical protein [Candidatus ainarchaeum sp.]
YLLLDRTTNFSSPYPNFDIGLLGTNITENGAVAISPFDNQTQVAAKGKNRTHYLPDTDALGQVSGNNDYVIAAFKIKADGGSSDVNFNVQTDTGKPIFFPNINLSNWNTDVSISGNNGNIWSLTTNTSSQTYLQKAYLDYGTRFDLDSNKLSIAGPENQAYLKLTVFATGS